MSDNCTAEFHPELHIIPVLVDNYCYVYHNGDVALAVDPSEAAPVLHFLEKNALRLERMLVTHGHSDHTGGCREIERKCGVSVTDMRDGEYVAFANSKILAIHSPGHTADHYCFFLQPPTGAPILFSGDTLFGGGCGRVSGGQYTQMWNSLLKLRGLPPETLVCFGHEYTIDNLEFALSIEPSNRHVCTRLKHDKARMVECGMTAPSKLSNEQLTNPFLRADDPVLQACLDLSGRAPLQVFSYLRERKNHWG